MTNDFLNELARLNMIRITDYEAVERLSSGSLVVDCAYGGLPRGRITEFFGNPGTGKTTLAMVAAAFTLANGGAVAYFDTEGTFDAGWANQLGISPENFWLIQPHEISGEAISNGILAAIRSGEFDLIVYDTHDAVIYNAELGKVKGSDEQSVGEMGDGRIGIRAQKLKEFCKRAADALKPTRTCLLLLSQMYSQIGVLYGDPDKATGGKGKEHSCTIRVKLLSKENVKEGTGVVGARFHGKVVKNKTMPEREFYVTVRQFFDPDGIAYYSVDHASDLLDLGKTYDVFVNKKGEVRGKTGAFVFEDVELGGSEEAAIKFLRGNPELRDRLEKVIREKMG